MIHIVGFRFGFEPKDRPEGNPRRSYTQMEYDIARELNKPVYVFLSADATVRDPNPGEQPEDAEAIQLQLAHRQALEQSNNIRYSFQTKTDLCLRAANIPLLATADFRVDISRIDRYAPAELIGREAELKLLDDAWLKVRRAEPKRPHILTVVALGGEGKTSLVAKWLADLAFDNWPGCDSAFAWSFYSQGSQEQSAASSDLFLKEAISFFGNDADKEFAASNAGAYEKGQHLARIVGQRRTLLILDGLEPLQYALSSPTSGELKDSGIAALLKGLAADSDGLCLVTTRYSLPNLKAYWQTTTREIPLTRLSLDAGVHLLKTFGVKGSVREFEKLVEDVKGHALTLNLLGTYLRDAHGGDIRRRDLVRLEDADVEEQSGHAFRLMEAYEEAFEAEGEKGKRALAILKLLGLFDRPVTADYLDILLKEPTISGLTEPLVRLTDAQRKIALKRLEMAKLLTMNYDASSTLLSLDAHPLLRSYFARQLRTQGADVWRTAHERVYKHLCATTPDKDEPTLEDLQPLYQAITHGCQAELHQEACDVYQDRIYRNDENYSARRLGAFGSELGALACFFDAPWTGVSPLLSDAAQAWVLAVAAFCLRATGRLFECAEALRVGSPIAVRRRDWGNAAVDANNLSELELCLGHIDDAVRIAEQAVKYENLSTDTDNMSIILVTQADALHQANRFSDAMKRSIEAEQILNPKYKFLFSIPGFKYCDLLLSAVERMTWRRMLRYPKRFSNWKKLHAVEKRATETLKIAERNGWPHEIGLDYLTLGRIALYETLLFEEQLLSDHEQSKAKLALGSAVRELRRAGRLDALSSSLMTRAWLRFLVSPHTGPESAQGDLDEAWEIAERGPMRLHMADIHLYRARLFFREKEYPWESPEADLTAARKLIEQCGYWRRKEELEDSERVILKKSV